MICPSTDGTLALEVGRLHDPGFPPLPKLQPVIVSFDRQEVLTAGGVWVIRASQDGGELLRLVFDGIQPDAAEWTLLPRTTGIVRLYIASLITRSKGKSVSNTLHAIRRFFAWYSEHHNGRVPDEKVIAWHLITADDLVNFKVHMEAHSAQRGNDFAMLRQMYDWGAFGLQLPDFDPYAAVYLSSVRAQGNVKGAAVRGRDALKGPLDDDEQRLVRQAVTRGVGEDQERAIVMLHYELGINPQATARMRNEDLHRYEEKFVGPDGTSRTETYYHLAVPRVKKRTEHREVKVRPISIELGDLLTRLQVGDSGARLIHWLRENYPEKHNRDILNGWARRANIISPRTREALRLSARRFRYTLATEMAKEGASRQKIAEVLDHSDLQNVEVYIEASSYVADQVDMKLAPRLDPFLRRFQGQVVDREQNPFPALPKRIVPGAAVQLPTLPVSVGGIGFCGKDVRSDGLCGLAPPLTCYACDKFAAFRDGPHGEIADAIEAIVEAGSEEADLRIPLQLTDALQAIRQLQAQIANETTIEENHA